MGTQLALYGVEYASQQPIVVVAASFDDAYATALRYAHGSEVVNMMRLNVKGRVVLASNLMLPEVEGLSIASDFEQSASEQPALEQSAPIGDNGSANEAVNTPD